MSPTHQDLSNDTTFSQIKSRVPVPLTLLVVVEGSKFVSKESMRFKFIKNNGFLDLDMEQIF